MTVTERGEVIFALICADLARGIGRPEQIEAWRELEWRKCAADVVYFIEKYGQIIDKDGTIIPFHLWPIQKMLLQDWQRGISVVAVKARQLGVTTLSAHFALWETIFKEASRWHIFSSSESKAQDIMQRIQATKDRLPAWMIERAQSKNTSDSGYTKRKDKSDSFARISFGLSEMKIMTSTPKSIQGSAGKFILDEFTQHTEKRRKIHMLLPAIDGGGMGIIIANGEGEDEFWQLYQQAKRGKNRFKPYFFMWSDDPRRDDAWYERAEEEFLLDPKNVDMDIAMFHAMYPRNEHEAFYLGGNSRFKLSRINEIMLSIHERSENNPDFSVVGMIEKFGNGYTFQKNSGGRWTLFEPPKPGSRYVVGVDTSGGSSAGDYGAIQVLKVQPKDSLGAIRTKQVAVYHAKVEPSLLAYEAEKAARLYLDARINVEANNHGGLALDKLRYSYHNLYMRKKNEKFTPDDTDLLGFWVTGNSKTYLIDQLAEHIHGGYVEVNDVHTVKELNAYEILENQKTAAKSGMNDDLVLGLAHAIECARDVADAYMDMEVISLMPWEDIEEDDRSLRHYL